MSETAPSSTFPADAFGASPDSKPCGLVAQYRLDHRNPVNHFLHVGVGWPMIAIAILLLPFRPLWSAALFVGGYAVMFFGHFAFERNVPTIFKEPSTPFVIAWSVIRKLWGALVRIASPQRGH